jgi:hypothetical protein
MSFYRKIAAFKFSRYYKSLAEKSRSSQRWKIASDFQPPEVSGQVV